MTLLSSKQYRCYTKQGTNCYQAIYKEGSMNVLYGCYELRDELNFRTQKHSTTLKSFSPTVNEVQLWNNLEMEMKRCLNINLFKYKYKQKIFEKYREEEIICQ